VHRLELSQETFDICIDQHLSTKYKSKWHCSFNQGCTCHTYSNESSLWNTFLSYLNFCQEKYSYVPVLRKTFEKVERRKEGKEGWGREGGWLKIPYVFCLPMQHNMCVCCDQSEGACRKWKCVCESESVCEWKVDVLQCMCVCVCVCVWRESVCKRSTWESVCVCKREIECAWERVWCNNLL